MIDFRVTLMMGGVRIRSGDIIFGDLDGVCVVPRDLEPGDIRACLEYAATQVDHAVLSLVK